MMLSTLRASIAVALCCALGACATRPIAPPTQSWPLLPPAALGHDEQVKQILRGAFATTTVSLQCVVTVSANEISVVGINAVGVRVFTVKYDGVRTTETHAPQVPNAVDPARLVNDLQLVFWPLDALAAALAPAGWDVSELPGTRRLTRAGRLVAEVHYADAHPWSGRVWLANFENRYSLSIDSSRLVSDESAPSAIGESPTSP